MTLSDELLALQERQEADQSKRTGRVEFGMDHTSHFWRPVLVIPLPKGER